MGDRRARSRLVVADDRKRDRVPGVFCAGRRRASAGSGRRGRAPRRIGGRLPTVFQLARPPTHCRYLGALFRWLIEQCYVLANPFAGIKVRGRTRVAPLDTARGFTEGEWALIRAIAEGLEWSYGWSEPAAQRLRFLLDFAYATGLRAGELVGATLGDVRVSEHGDHWLHLVGKGSRPGKVAVPPLARTALDRYLTQRRLTVPPVRWEPKTPLIASLGEDSITGITGTRLWHVIRRVFRQAADVIGTDHPVVVEKLRRASPHWTRHTTQHMLSPAAPSSVQCATTYAMHQSRPPRFTCRATRSNRLAG